MKLDELPRETLDSPSIERLAAVIPQLRRTIVERAAAVVAADQARGSTTIEPGSTLLETQRAVSAASAARQPKPRPSWHG